MNVERDMETHETCGERIANELRLEAYLFEAVLSFFLHVLVKLQQSSYCKYLFPSLQLLLQHKSKSPT